MSNYGKMAKTSGGAVVVAAYELFFTSETSAKVNQQKYGGHLSRLDDGWLLKVPIDHASDDDPIVEAIRRAIKDAGLTS